MRAFPGSMVSVPALLAGAGLLCLSAGSALADEPRSATEPRVMMESGEVTQVIDAFDDGDPFDINISLGYEYTNKSATILRETAINEPNLTTGNYTGHRLKVAAFSETQHRLVPRVDIGVYKDLAVHVAVPVILSNARELSGVDGSENKTAVTLQGAPGEQLFSLPFKSPTRSGLDHIAAGLDFNILNQFRDSSKPTWVIGAEGRFSVGTPMHACNPSPAAGQLDCANPADIDRNGQQNVTDRSGNALEGVDVAQRKAGVTRGTIALEVHSYASKRIKYIEPYGGFSALFEFQQESSDFGVGDVSESLVNHPPLVGTMVLGMMIIPWENREKFGRLTFDLRMMGQYHSEGRDYSELFDALGSSTAGSLRNPEWERYKANPSGNPSSVVDEGSSKIFFTGLTDVQAYGSYRMSGSATWQASEYVKFQFGMGFRHDQAHLLTTDQPCNPAFKDDIGKSGPCHGGDESSGGSIFATGVPNPNYRPTINAVGRRFFVDNSNTIDIFASGVVMF
ncbi:MAG: hypothetical protein U0359_07420 [Byssovorax sp.]